MKTGNIFKAALAAAMLAAAFSCAKEIETETVPCEIPGQIGGPKTYTMSVMAAKGSPATKALNLNDGTLSATWAQGEKVTVYNKTKGADLEGYLEALSSGANATLEGDLTGTVEPGDELTLKFLAPDYDGQDGTLQYIATHCDYATAEVTVKSVDGGKITATKAANFTNQQAIVKFTLKESDGSAISGGVNSLSLTFDGKSITVTPTSSTNELWVALPGIYGIDLSLRAYLPGDGGRRVYNRTGVVFLEGEYYEIGVKMAAVQAFSGGTGTEGDPYLISSTADWNQLAEDVNNGITYSGKFFRQTNEVDVLTMVGNSETNAFSGTYDGDGNMLYVRYETSEQYTAPFRYVNGATVKNLHVDGTITVSNKFAASVFGNAEGANEIRNCRSSVTINSSVSGDGSHGGFVARIGGNDTSIYGCLFDGRLLGSSTTDCGGFIGWVATNNSGRASVFDSIFDPAEVTFSDSGSKTFARYYPLGYNNLTLPSAYYIQSFGEAQGKAAYSLTPGPHTTLEIVYDASSSKYYDVSGIFSYGTEIGIKYNDVDYVGYGSYSTSDSFTLNLGTDLSSGLLAGGYSITPSGHTFTQITENQYSLGVENIPGDIVVTVNMNDDIYSFNVPYLDPGDNDTYVECVKDVCIKLSSFDRNNPVTLTSGWYVVDQEVLNFNERITIQFDHEVHIILADNTTLNANKGIFLPSSGSTELHIWGQTHTLKTDGGRLNATSTDRGFPGIGGIGGGYLNFHGGYTVARGGEWAAGINGCPNDVNNRFAIIVSGGYVEGHGGEGDDAVGGGAGIGGNPAQICCSVLITGGCAVGYAGHRAAGIGSGCDGVMHNTSGFSYVPSSGNHSRFYMTGGSVLAVGATGAGIGGGEGCDFYRGDGFDVRIDGGELFAYTIDLFESGLENDKMGATAIGWGFNRYPTKCDTPIIYSGAKIEACSTSWDNPLTTVSYSEFRKNFTTYKKVKISPGD